MLLYPKNKVKQYRDDNGILCVKHLPYTKTDMLYFKLIFWPIISPVLGFINSKRSITDKAVKDITDVEVDGINHRDHPDYCDAFISSALWRSSLTPLTEAQLNQLNDKHSDFVYESVMDKLY